MKHVDYIIVGGGISGSVLSYTLMKYGAAVQLFDCPEQNLSSKVAAGLWNPIVLKRLKKVWRADEMMEELATLYPSMEQWSKASFYQSIPIRRVFHSPGEQNNWLGLTGNEAFAPYMEDTIAPLPEGVIGHHGSAMMKRTGRLHVNTMTKAVANRLDTQGYYSKEKFDWSKVMRNDEGVEYDGLRAHGIISCQGAQLAIGKGEIAQNGFAPVKGEILRIKLDRDIGNECIHQRYFMLGEQNKECSVGATYAWDGFENGPTAEKRLELEEHMKSVWLGTKQTINHTAGIRPATKDRRPMVGPHEHLQHTWIFNGMGSRAVLMTPWLARVLVEHLMYGSELLQECLPSRFKASS